MLRGCRELTGLNWGNASHFEKPTFAISQMRKQISEAIYTLTMTNLENSRARKSPNGLTPGSGLWPPPHAALWWAFDPDNLSNLWKGAKITEKQIRASRRQPGQVMKTNIHSTLKCLSRKTASNSCKVMSGCDSCKHWACILSST